MNEQIFQGLLLCINGLVGVGMLWLNSKFDKIKADIQHTREISDLKHKVNEEKIMRIESHCGICENRAASLH